MTGIWPEGARGRHQYCSAWPIRILRLQATQSDRDKTSNKPRPPICRQHIPSYGGISVLSEQAAASAWAWHWKPSLSSLLPTLQAGAAQSAHKLYNHKGRQHKSLTRQNLSLIDFELVKSMWSKTTTYHLSTLWLTILHRCGVCTFDFRFQRVSVFSSHAWPVSCLGHKLLKGQNLSFYP